MTFDLRRAREDDAKIIAKILGDGVKIDLPFLPVLHTEEEDLNYTKNTILANYDVWVAVNGDDKPVGFISFENGNIHQLYVLNQYQGQKIGSALIKIAKDTFPELVLWTFQKSKARTFYEAQGFTAVKFTDGAKNDEKEPDVFYTWKKELTP